MKFQSFRSAVVIASVMVASVTASQAFAQDPIDVLKGLTVDNAINTTLESTYTFNQSMILNSIGFLSEGLALTTINYSFGSDIPTPLLASQLSVVDANGLRWYTFDGGLSVNALSVLKVTTLGVYVPAVTNRFDETVPAYYSTRVRTVGSTDPSSNITYNGMNFGGTSKTNSNLRVSNPSSNVAPEPGSFALALTGGAALLGICIRRRRNAA
jgi:hypothetical protein